MSFVALSLSAAIASSSIARELTFEERVKAQVAIERVYWQHRLWPNPTPKPPLDAVMSQSAIRGKVAGYMRRSSELSITASDLAAETARISRDTHNPVMLRELFAALGDDAAVITETLSRQTLVARGGTAVDANPASAVCSDDTWRAGSSGNDARYRHTAVWTGTEAIVWGGFGPSGATDTGGRYDPTTDSWSTTAVGTNTPRPRTDHSAVWTGTEMIVWGGRLETPAGMVVNTGGRYDPATDTWSPTSTGASVPVGRDMQTAIWTGTEMIVWGGEDRFGHAVNTGGRYVPVTDSWTPTSIGSDVPAGRWQHSAVWTGKEMIVWGGHDYGWWVGTGGRYDPKTDRWRATSAPPADFQVWRSVHTAVWTGSEMIIWGGFIYPGDSANTGARYDPSTDQWTSTSTGPHVPSRRRQHSAVWTGSEMIIWGGYHTQDLNTGGRYDTRTDTWTETSVGEGVPTARGGQAALWTGSEMLVLGGFSIYGPPVDGMGRYCAVSSCDVRTWYRDLDGDGFGLAVDSVLSCDKPPSYAAATGDCDDDNPGAYPGATDVCNAIDDDCSGAVDDSSEAQCDDGNPCTTDSCHGAFGCFQTMTPGAACDDGNACTTADACGQPSASLLLAEDFDSVLVPAIPTGWTTSEIGNGSPWVTRSLGSDTAPNAIFGADSALESDERLVSPAISIGSANATLTFRNRWSFDDTYDGLTECFDGGMLEISMDGGPYVDILAAGGSFASGGYSGAISVNWDNPLAGRAAWCFTSLGYPGYVVTEVHLPPDAAGRVIRFRWRIGCDSAGFIAGQDIDSIVVNDRTSRCAGGPYLECEDGECCTVDACDPASGCTHTANTEAPVFTVQPSLGNAILWPPNHGYADLALAETGVAAASACGIASIEFASCRSSQPENASGTGDGNTLRDCVYESTALHLRAERDGACSPIGRVYETTIAATDVCGNRTTSDPFRVDVWHNRGGPPPAGTIVHADGSGTTRVGTNGAYGSDCGLGDEGANGTVPDDSDTDPEMEISQNAAVSVDDLRIVKAVERLRLQWTEPVNLAPNHVTRYHVYRLDPATLTWLQLAEVSAQTTSFQDSILDDGHTWHYKVTAVIK